LERETHEPEWVPHPHQDNSLSNVVPYGDQPRHSGLVTEGHDLQDDEGLSLDWHGHGHRARWQVHVWWLGVESSGYDT
jgi:hypothetical protein